MTQKAKFGSICSSAICSTKFQSKIQSKIISENVFFYFSEFSKILTPRKPRRLT